MCAGIRRELVSAISHVLSDRTGLWVSPPMQRRLERLLLQRIAVGNYRHASEYYHFLRDDPFSRNEISKLVSLLTRHKPRLMNPAVAELVRRFAIPWAAENGRCPAILAVGTRACEDAYSAAIVLGKAGLDVASRDVTMTAADIDLGRLVHGGDGVYTRRAVARIDDQALESYFERVSTHRFRVRRSLRDRIRWLYVNPLRWTGSLYAGMCDVIICREFLNYLTFSTHEVWKQLGSLLPPGGLLICDRPLALDGPFDLAQAGRYWIHTRRGQGDCPQAAPHPAEAELDAGLMEAMSILARGDRGSAERDLAAAIQGDPFNVSYRVAMVLLLLRKQSFRGSRAEAITALFLDPHSPHVLLACGIVQEQLNSLRSAEHFYRKALLVRPTMAAAYLHLAELYEKSGRYRDAARACAHLREVMDRQGQTAAPDL